MPVNRRIKICQWVIEIVKKKYFFFNIYRQLDFIMNNLKVDLKNVFQVFNLSLLQKNNLVSFIKLELDQHFLFQ